MKIGYIADFKPGFVPHQLFTPAIQHAANHLDTNFDVQWLPTELLLTLEGQGLLKTFDGIWAGTGSPFRSLDGTLAGIKFARENDIPFLATCAGFQHVILEYARNVLGHPDATSEQYNSSAPKLFISRLACPLTGLKMTIRLNPGFRAHNLYGTDTAIEEYYCKFGLNPSFKSQIKGLSISGEDQDGEFRVLELPNKRFFLATLFVPEANSTASKPHPIVVGFVKAGMEYSSRKETASQG